jgi:hypothetical protein
MAGLKLFEISALLRLLVLTNVGNMEAQRDSRYKPFVEFIIVPIPVIRR